MLVVLAIIGIIATILTPGLIGQLGRARAKSAQTHLETVAAATEMFRSDVGRYPTDAEGLAVLLADPGVEGWTGPYMKSAKALEDPWGRPVTYRLGSGGLTFTVTSLGRDGVAQGSGLDKDLEAPRAQ
jgi:general secretion pathway protein G